MYKTITLHIRGLPNNARWEISDCSDYFVPKLIFQRKFCSNSRHVLKISTLDVTFLRLIKTMKSKSGQRAKVCPNSVGRLHPVSRTL